MEVKKVSLCLLTTLQPHYNTFLYSAHLLITPYRHGSHCLYFLCIRPSFQGCSVITRVENFQAVSGRFQESFRKSFHSKVSGKFPEKFGNSESMGGEFWRNDRKGPFTQRCSDIWDGQNQFIKCPFSLHYDESDDLVDREWEGKRDYC